MIPAAGQVVAPGLPAASGQARATGDAVTDIGLDPFQLLLQGDRTELGFLRRRVSDADVPGLGDQAIEDLVINPVLHKTARARDAGLAGRGEYAGHHASPLHTRVWSELSRAGRQLEDGHTRNRHRRKSHPTLPVRSQKSRQRRRFRESVSRALLKNDRLMSC